MVDVTSLLEYGGLLLVFLVVYAQTGLFFCFFLPSGGLMFTAGVFMGGGQMNHHPVVVGLVLIAGAVLGHITGYIFGRKTGPLLYERKPSKYFKREHLQSAEKFFDQYGSISLAAGPFFPIIRTFAPIVAGMIRMDVRRFLVFSTLGAMAWITSFVMAGYLIGSMPFLKPYLTWIVLGIIVAVTIPIVVSIVRKLKRSAAA